MRIFRLTLVSVFLLASATTGGALAAKAAAAKTAKAAAVKAPLASADELAKIKGDFKWGMSPDEVLVKMVERVESSYEARINKAANDPAKQDRVRKEMRAEVEKVKEHSLVKFDGQKTGYDVSIIDQEFIHGNNESMLVGKDDNATRYFFFDEGRLYKMFIAFDKDMLQGKDFKQFGQLMQARFGKAREVYVDEKSKAGVAHKLDHYAWTSKTGDVLRLVDRSSFYDVYCLVIGEGAVMDRLAEVRRAHAKTARTDALVEAVTTGKPSDRDSNDSVIDDITGRKVRKPGEEDNSDIKVPMPAVKAPTPAEVNRAEPQSDSAKPAASGNNGKKKAGKGKEAKPKSDL
jgi:hypothetical protein